MCKIYKEPNSIIDMGKIQIVLDKETEDKFRKQLIKSKENFKRGSMSEEIRKMIIESLDKISLKFPIYKQKDLLKIDKDTLNEIEKFYDQINTLEKELGKGLIIFLDKKSGAFYTECHISAEEFTKKEDIDAVVDPDNQEEFRLNRNLNEKHTAFKEMLSDAKEGRQFSDIVIDFNNDYKAEKPLKILGGQHRVVAIRRAYEKEKVNRTHGIKIYFNLSTSKRVEIAEIANTNINISADLRDRLKEQQLNPPGRLRDWAWHIGILKKGLDFADKRRKEQEEPTVKMMRTFLVNFYDGLDYTGALEDEAKDPYLCTSGGMDPRYKKLFDRLKKKDFKDYKELTEAGKKFMELHKKQFKTANKSHRYRAFALAVISSWAFTAGVLQKNKKYLNKLYSIPEKSTRTDPLNGEAMSKARNNKYDSDTYRGLGTRYNDKERGRLLQFFYRYSRSDKENITLNLYNAAINIYHHKKESKSIKKDESLF